jgi:hypothetical protein
LKGKGVSSWGVTPAWFHTFDVGLVELRDGLCSDVRVGRLDNQSSIRAGAMDVSDFGATRFAMLGIAGLPGAIDWLTR